MEKGIQRHEQRGGRRSGNQTVPVHCGGAVSPAADTGENEATGLEDWAE